MSLYSDNGGKNLIIIGFRNYAFNTVYCLSNAVCPIRYHFRFRSTFTRYYSFRYCRNFSIKFIFLVC